MWPNSENSTCDNSQKYKITVLRSAIIEDSLTTFFFFFALTLNMLLALVHTKIVRDTLKQCPLEAN